MEKELMQYLTTALWSSTDFDGEPLDSEYTIYDINQEDVQEAAADLKSFTEKIDGLVTNHDPDRVAHDFWLTRNGHGAGFWDGDYVNGDKLTEIAKSFGEITPYIGDDGMIYMS